MADDFDDFEAEDEMPPAVVSPLLQMAIVTHETYSAFVDAGFKENQALALTMKTLELTIYAEYSIEDFEELGLEEDE
jgi:hypothetical protein